MSAPANQSATAVNDKPALKAYKELQDAYVFFNERLFDGELPSTPITLQRGRRTFGSFSLKHSLLDILATLAHEMRHVWQRYCAKSCRFRQQDGVYRPDAI
jgi:hypothetical protein